MFVITDPTLASATTDLTTKDWTNMKNIKDHKRQPELEDVHLSVSPPAWTLLFSDRLLSFSSSLACSQTFSLSLSEREIRRERDEEKNQACATDKLRSKSLELDLLMLRHIGRNAQGLFS